MEIGRIFLLAGVSVFLLGYVISMIRYCKFKDFYSRFFQAIFGFLIFVGVLANVMFFPGKSWSLVVDIIMAIFLFLCVIWDVIYLNRIYKNHNHFTKIHGRKYIVRNISDKD